MKHLLDYEILKEWGFEWATKHDFGNGDIVTSYLKSKGHETDAHGFIPIRLTLLPHQNIGSYWVMSYMSGNNRSTLFKGNIINKTMLRYILKACIIFKSNKESNPDNILFDEAGAGRRPGSFDQKRWQIDVLETTARGSMNINFEPTTDDNNDGSKVDYASEFDEAGRSVMADISERFKANKEALEASRDSPIEFAKYPSTVADIDNESPYLFDCKIKTFGLILPGDKGTVEFHIKGEYTLRDLVRKQALKTLRQIL